MILSLPNSIFPVSPTFLRCFSSSQRVAPHHNRHSSPKPATTSRSCRSHGWSPRRPAIGLGLGAGSSYLGLRVQFTTVGEEEVVRAGHRGMAGAVEDQWRWRFEEGRAARRPWERAPAVSGGGRRPGQRWPRGWSWSKVYRRIWSAVAFSLPSSSLSL
jgi:hypothetical protein